ncbi:MAG: RIP metalloprotease RseP [Bilifractor sp.]
MVVRILLAILLLSIVVLFHEWGHYLLAKANHITVTEFSLGFGPRLISFEKNGTRYSWKAIPFGGSCAMLGEDEADEDTPGAFNWASPLARISVVAAGPVFNFILAFAMSMILVGISGTRPALVDEVTDGSPAMEAGLQPGDEIVRYEGNGIAGISELNFDVELDGIPTDEISLTYVRDGKKHKISYAPSTENVYRFGFTYSEGSDGTLVITLVSKGSAAREAGMISGDEILAVNGTEVSSIEDLQNYYEENPLDGSPVTFRIRRNSKTFDMTITPEKKEVASLGFTLATEKRTVGFPGIIKAGIDETGYWIHVTWKSLGGLLTGAFSVQEMSGPVGIVNAVGSVYEQAKQYGALEVFLELLQFAILLSANLGVMNLIPFPALDGGRLVFLVIEAIRKKPVNRKIEGAVNFVGFAALMCLMVFVCVNDVLKLF